MEATMLSTRARWAVGVTAVAALVSLAVAAVLLRGGVTDFGPATPEGTAQGYLQAMLDGDHRGALDYLTPELREACRAEARRAWVPESARVALAATLVEGDHAEVDVVITELDAPSPFEPGDLHSVDVTLVMERSGDGWSISERPWPMWGCEVTP